MKNILLSNFLNFLVSSPYYIQLEGHGGRFGDMDFDLEIFPNSRLSYWSDAKFDFRRRSFREANFNTQLTLSERTKFAAGYSYLVGNDDAGIDDSKVFTFFFEHHLNPKWIVKTYHRLNFAKSSMIQEQEYTIARDLHCWEVEFTVNAKQKKGATFWLGFRCKAFPDLGFNASAATQQPKTR